VIERLLLYVEATPGMARTTAWTLELARTLSCRVFAVAVMNAPSAAAAKSRADDAEERAWGLLYEIEDDAFDKDVKISLLLEQGDQLQRVLDLSANYDVGLIVAGADCRLPAVELVRRSSRPVVFVK
jgi:nucleotide-binding universal stress UspA family protein